MHDKLAHLIKHNPIIQFTYRAVMSAFFRLLGLFIKTDDRLVLLSSYGGKQFNDSPKVLFEAMLCDPRFHGFKYVWAFEKPEDYDIQDAQKVKIDSLAYFVFSLKAKVWITNVNIERGLDIKKRNTIYLNTWHGTGPKKGGNAVKGRKDYDFSRVDIFCCDGTYTRDIFLKWFNASEKSMLWCGRPREDELLQFDECDREQIRGKLGIPREKKMILYMPTWREYGNQEIDYNYWAEKLGSNYVMCVRIHHFAEKGVYQCREANFLKDVTKYSNVNELYIAADVLISDYSSAFFDYGLLGKPMLCYAYDYERYQAEWGLFMDLEKDFPNGVLRTADQVIGTILNMDYEQECKKCKEYCNRYVSHFENATAICLDEIYKRL